MHKLIAFFLGFALVAGCSKQETEMKSLIVADHKVDCQGEGITRCLLIKEKEDAQWQYFYGAIEGFQYEEGFEYRIRVQVKRIPNPPADASSIKYILTSIISKQ